MRPELKFVKRLQSLFGTPSDNDFEGMVAEYVNALTGQSAATLDRAADHLARTHKFRNWPTVAECLDAVAVAKRNVNVASMGLEKIDDFDGWWAERLARIRIAKNDKQIDHEIRQIEPYSIARWIAPNRLPDALALAKEVRDGLRRQEARSRAEDITGDR